MPDLEFDDLRMRSMRIADPLLRSVVDMAVAQAEAAEIGDVFCPACGQRAVTSAQIEACPYCGEVVFVIWGTLWGPRFNLTCPHRDHHETCSPVITPDPLPRRVQYNGDPTERKGVIRNL